MARQGRCVAEASVRDAASRGREQARQGVGMPARVVPLAAVRIWLIVVRSAASPGVPFVRAPTPGGAPGRRPDVGGMQVGATRRRDRSPPGRRPEGIDVDAVEVVRADGYRPLWGLPYIEAARRAAITTATPRRRAGSWCVTGGSASVGWTRRPSVGLQIERFAGLSAAAGSVAQTRNDEPKPVGKNLTVRWQVWSSALSDDRGTPEHCERGDLVRGHADAESGSATEHVEDEISITVPRVGNSQSGKLRGSAVTRSVCANVSPATAPSVTAARAGVQPSAAA